MAFAIIGSGHKSGGKNANFSVVWGEKDRVLSLINSKSEESLEMNIINRMRRAVFYAVISLIFLFAAICGFYLNAYTEESKLVSLDRNKDITIIVGYDTEKTKVAFISPSGKRYEKEENFNQVADDEKST